MIRDNCFPRRGFGERLIRWCQATCIVHAKARGEHNTLALYRDRGLGSGRCEMSFLNVVCSHPGEAHKADKAEQSFIGGFVQASVWEHWKLSMAMKGC